MADDIVDLTRERMRRQPPVPLTLGAFLLLVLGAMLVVVVLIAAARLLERGL